MKIFNEFNNHHNCQQNIYSLLPQEIGKVIKIVIVN